jgi:hypothetical protein
MRIRKNQISFRPRISEILESRAVPATTGVLTPTGIPGLFVKLPTQVSLANPQVQAAFTAFDASYVRAVDALLSAAGPDGLFVPSSSRAAFVQAIDQSLTTLAEQLVASLSPGSTTTTTTTGSTTTAVANQVTAAIVGNGSNSLESELLGLSLAQLQLSIPNPLASTGGSGQALVPNAVTTAELVRQTTRVPVAEAVGPATTGADATATTSPSSPSSIAANDVRSAFTNFLNDYFGAVQKVLLAPGSSPQANRAAFNAKVAQSLQSLENSLTATLGRYPATAGLGPQIKAAIEGPGASSLQGQLASLATPQGAQAAVVREFTLGSTQAIAQALALISGDVSKLIGPAGQ